MNSILEKINDYKKQEVKKNKALRPLSALYEHPPLPIRDFITPLRTTRPAIIAEIKKASPSKGILCKQFNVEAIADAYAENGASCLSVLTDRHFFQGDHSYLAKARQRCQLPVLRKDFIIDPYQIHESRMLGADCILLIAAMLDDVQLLDFCQMAQDLGMAVLVESHTLEELKRAIQLPTPLMGINNRSLHTFKTDLEQSIRLKHHIPDDKIIISESGISTRENIDHLQAHGIHVFLIGESLVRSDNIGQSLRQLCSPTA